MRFTPTILLASALTTAQAQDAQKPLLASWLDKAKSYVSSGIPSPSDAGAAAIARATITELTTANWKQELRAEAGKPSPQNWLIQITGGNKTCAGRCEALDANFNKTAALLSATPGGPHLARLNCENNPALCSIWFTGPPVLWYVQVPGVEQADQSRAPTPIYIKTLNATTPTSVQDMVDVHTKKTYLDRQPFMNLWHPFDGQLAQIGLNTPLGYFLYFMSVIPSWSVMLLVSFATRTMMTRRVQARNTPDMHTAGARPAAGGAVPATAPKKTN